MTTFKELIRIGVANTDMPSNFRIMRNGDTVEGNHNAVRMPDYLVDKYGRYADSAAKLGMDPSEYTLLSREKKRDLWDKFIDLMMR